MTRFIARVLQAYAYIAAWSSARARRVPGFALLLDAWAAYRRDEMGILAASLGYYVLLAIFPLLLLIIAAASPFIASETVVAFVVRSLRNYLPTIGPELGPLLREALAARGTVTLVALAGLLWSASGVFDVVQLGLNRAYRVARPRPLWRQRLVSLLTVVGLAVLFGASFGISAVTGGGFRLRFLLGNRTVTVFGLLLNTLLGIGLFGVAYKVLPVSPVRWRQVWRAAVFASVTWEVAKIIFVYYLLNFARLNVVYGSVGVVIALLTWGYITAAILLFGGELSALIVQKERAGS